MSRVKDKVAIVTGAASGLGRDIATLLAEEGARVTLTDINEAQGRDVAQSIKGDVRFVRQDVTDEDGWSAIIKDTAEVYGGLDVLVNNAGVVLQNVPQDPEATHLEDWRRIHQVNVEGVFLGCKHAIPAMRISGGGSIVNMSSVAALVATPFITAYGASKAAVRQLTKSVALHCAQNGSRVRCNSVHPGQILTPMLEGLFEDAARQAGAPLDAVRGEFLKKIPIGEFGEPRDIAYGVLYLASDEAKHVTGIKLAIDGGITLNP